MQRYRVTGAYRETGEPFEGEFIALNEHECADQASRRGVLITSITPLAPGATFEPLATRQLRKRRRKRSQPLEWRGVVRGIARANAALLMVPGLLMFAGSALICSAALLQWVLSLASEDADAAQLLGLPLTFAVMVTGIAWSLLLLLASALLYLVLYIEDHLHAIRKAMPSGR